MPRRREDGALVDPGSDGEVEILDPLTPRPPNEATDLAGSEGGRWGSIGPALGAALIAGLAILSLSVAGNNPPPESPAPSVTTPRNEEDELDRRQQEAAYGVRIGDGPGLVWEPVVWDIDASDARWIDGGFVADDGVTEWTIRSGALGPSIGQRQSLLVDYPGYELLETDGARVLAPRDAPLDHVLVFGFDEEPVRLEFPRDEPVTDLLDEEPFIDLAVVDSVAVALVGEYRTIDPEALSLRLGRAVGDVQFAEVRGEELYLFAGRESQSVSLTEISLSDAELALLASPASWAEPDPDIVRFDLATGAAELIAVGFDMSWGTIRRQAQQFVLQWADDSTPNNRSTSFGGRSWTTKRGTGDPYTIVTDSERLYGLSPGQVRISRSTDGGTTWRRTPNPLRNGTFLVVDDVIVLRDLAEIATGSDDEDSSPPDIAITRWTDDEPDPVWKIEQAKDLFGPETTDVRFIAGVGQILAVVDTARGPEFHLASTQPATENEP